MDRLQELSQLINHSEEIRIMADYKAHADVNKWVQDTWDENFDGDVSEEYRKVLQGNAYVYVNNYWKSTAEKKKESAECDCVAGGNCESAEDYDKFCDNPMDDYMDWFWKSQF